MEKIKLVLGATALCLALNASAQETSPSVEKSIFNVQAGTFGFWISNETRLAETITLRTEVGAEVWFYDTYYDGSGSFMAPSINIEPRWYYNIKKRAGKGKNTANNSANFVTIGIEYFPDTFTIGDHPNYINVPNQISIIPKWAMRRHIAGSKFNYELGAGVGYLGYLSDNDARINEGSEVALDLHIRIGYTF